MKHFRAKRGPFADRPYFEQAEIENICLDELRKVGLLPSVPGPVRIERFIEKRFHVNPSYEDLPDGVLGFTKFTSQGVQAVVVARALSEEGTKAAERRINTTLAHEAGHGLLHAHLFALAGDGAALFGGAVDPKTPKILCRDEAVAGRENPSTSAYDGRWWEYQANCTIGALLLPKLLVVVRLEEFLEKRGSFGVAALDERRRGEATQALSDTFDVNPVVARLRLTEVFGGPENGQLEL